MRFVACVVGLALVGCGSSVISSSPDAGRPVDAGIVAVSLRSLTYQPANETVNQGMTITWTNDDTVLHTVTSGPPGQPDGRFDEQLPPGASFSYTFKSPGSYPYFCRIHYTMGMVGSVTVAPTANP
ncbi:MAG TPA: plastocyanin/azurin family copper-binding protein [Myxococcales bacterium]|nr:plastocyanin/azurin family copper-binding protein [Myxococcales bacterium]